MLGLPAAAAALGLFGSVQPLPELSGEYSENGRVVVRATSGGFRLPGGATVLTRGFHNHEHNGPVGYRDNGGWYGFLPSADLSKDGAVVPSAVLHTWTTYRPVGEADGSVSYTLPLAPAVDTQITGRRWAEGGRAAVAEPGRALVAWLTLPDRRERVVCTSAVAGNTRDGLTYSYVVRNETRRPLKFEWGEYSGKVEPGRSRSFEAKSADVFAEQSGACTVSFENADHTFRTTAWLPPSR
jgi:hypothetical protein